MYEEVSPSAKNLISSLRDIGYTLDTAVADIIDNSITAGATEIDIFADFDNRNSTLTIIDNGKGMSESELKNAMRLGSFDPLSKRKSGDLGRFGLGLKTASFSQANKLTVVSKTIQGLCGREWDLEYVSQKNKWLLGVLNREDITNLKYFEQIKGSGTLVIWHDLDRIIESSKKRTSEKVFNEKINLLINHLELIFHRFLSGEAKKKKLIIRLNGHQLEPFDPFDSKNAVLPMPEEDLNGIKIQPYILPHHSKVSVEEYKRLEGKDGYLKTQGFYVYRGDRLLISGTWFRLAKQSEATKLARVKIELDNNSDFDWKLDVKKSRATPPEHIREELKRFINKIIKKSSRVYTSRGAKINKKEYVPVWIEHHKHGVKSFSINRDHPFIHECTDIDEALKIVEENIPYDAIFSKLSSDPKSLDKSITIDYLEELFEKYIQRLKSKGLSDKEAINKIRVVEPFSDDSKSFNLLLERRGHEY